MAWQLQTAKNKFSELVDKAIKIGPQEVTRHGHKAVVVLSTDAYRRLRGRRKGNLADFFRDSPLRGLELDLERRKDYPRAVDL
jgi:prevent-host-death family protein